MAFERLKFWKRPFFLRLFGIRRQDLLEVQPLSAQPKRIEWLPIGKYGLLKYYKEIEVGACIKMRLKLQIFLPEFS